MAFMSKKKRYKFEVRCCVEELTEVPFVSAVLFAKLRLLDGGTFQDHSTREEVRNHAVAWNARFTFVCKMSANASTGVLEPALLRVSVRKESKGGRSYQKLGFCDVDLASLAGAGECTQRRLLEGYDPRRRQDNSVLRLTIRLSMIAGDPVFKVPERKLEAVETGERGERDAPSPAPAPPAPPADDDCASSTASSGFGSLTKKKNLESGPQPSSLSSETLEPESEAEEHTNVQAGGDGGAGAACPSCVQHTHSRNSSNTSGDISSKASGYGSGASAASAHSRCSSDGDDTRPHKSFRLERSAIAPKVQIPKHTGLNSTQLDKSSVSESSELYLTPNCTHNAPDLIPRQLLSPPLEEYKTPDTTLITDCFAKDSRECDRPSTHFQILKQKSLNAIAGNKSKKIEEQLFTDFPFLTPLAHRKSSLAVDASKLPGCMEDEFYCIPSDLEACELESVDVRSRFKSMSNRNLEKEEVCASTPKDDVIQRTRNGSERCRRPHTTAVTLRHSYSEHVRNPSVGSLSASEGGSLERARAALERRRVPPAPTAALPTDADPAQGGGPFCRVENTRVNPDSLIDELLAATDLARPHDDAAETSGLQLYITSDGTAQLGSRRRALAPRPGLQRVALRPTHDR